MKFLLKSLMVIGLAGILSSAAHAVPSIINQEPYERSEGVQGDSTVPSNVNQDPNDAKSKEKQTSDVPSIINQEPYE